MKIQEGDAFVVNLEDAWDYKSYEKGEETRVATWKETQGYEWIVETNEDMKGDTRIWQLRDNENA